jgi:hypothetical protein
MAERRMYTKKITDSDAFTEMPSASQALYFHLNQGADDDGFNNQIQMAMFKAHASTDDLKILLAKNFIIRFESGVIVIKHSRMHNTIRKDRYTPTNFQDELEQLGITDNGAYTHWLPNGCQMVATGKVSIGKDSIDKDNISIKSDKPTRKNFIPPTLEDVQAYCKERNNTVDAERFINHYTSNGWMVGKNKMKDWKAAVRTWEKNGYSNNQQKGGGANEKAVGNTDNDKFAGWEPEGGYVL